MRQIDQMTPSEIDTLYVKGMLGSRPPNTTKTKPMPTTIKLKKRIKDADKKHSVIFSTEQATPVEQEIVDSIYFKRPFADSVKEITLTIVRDIDAKIDSL
jgi:hypothetical protein